MLEEMVASLDSGNFESYYSKGTNYFLSSQPWEATHDATLIVCTPTKSSGSKLSPWASRHTSTASRIRIINSSKDRACE